MLVFESKKLLKEENTLMPKKQLKTGKLLGSVLPSSKTPKDRKLLAPRHLLQKEPCDRVSSAPSQVWRSPPEATGAMPLTATPLKSLLGFSKETSPTGLQ